MSARPDELAEHDLAVLEFARHWWNHTGLRDQAIRDRFDITPIRYDQQLNALLDNPAAYRAHPMLVKRLRRLREQRQAARNARQVRSASN